MDELQGIFGMVGDVGVWAVFAYLFIQERKAHENTRNEYRDDLRSAAGFGQLMRHPAVPADTEPPRATS